MIEITIVFACLYVSYLLLHKPGEKFFYED